MSNISSSEPLNLLLHNLLLLHEIKRFFTYIYVATVCHLKEISRKIKPVIRFVFCLPSSDDVCDKCMRLIHKMREYCMRIVHEVSYCEKVKCFFSYIVAAAVCHSKEITLEITLAICSFEYLFFHCSPSAASVT